MTHKEILACMSDLSFFNAMNVEEREELICMSGHVKEFEEKETIARQGEVDKAFFVVLKGSLSVTRDKPPEVFLAQLVPGSLFGELTLRGERVRSSSVTADGLVVVLKVNQSLLDNVSASVSTKIKDKIIDHLVNRLDQMSLKLSSVIR
ncbi:MAG: cyclic nucleotide-binding domain-containing protein [Candidatus Nitronauta litoralis]|uniref:Cyclic nucleotide-binding domain-containing protein n=1 Tax=Candidatus Nitronauta litoralis TaxID=2705533 RepID=A0A7T0BUN1_9BACT|nr:MAG: cyclic nucleotide-binding domain-containing protein [Candidatus Nitronauta litoralis]